MTSVLTIYGFDLLQLISELAKPVAIIAVIGMVIYLGTENNKIGANTRRKR